MTAATTRQIAPPARRALRIGGWANMALASAHTAGLIWAWQMFRATDIEPEMRSLAEQGAALPYVLTLITAAFFLAFGLYGLSAAEDVRRLAFLRLGVAAIAVIYVCRATLFGGIKAVAEGDVAQIVFALIALLIGLCYAYGAVAQRRAPQLLSAAA